MNYCKVTGNKLRTSAEDAAYWAERNEALRVRLARMPKGAAVALCHEINASDIMGWSAKAVCADYLAKTKT